MTKTQVQVGALGAFAPSLFEGVRRLIGKSQQLDAARDAAVNEAGRAKAELAEFVAADEAAARELEQIVTHGEELLRELDAATRSS